MELERERKRDRERERERERGGEVKEALIYIFATDRRTRGKFHFQQSMIASCR